MWEANKWGGKREVKIDSRMWVTSCSLWGDGAAEEEEYKHRVKKGTVSRDHVIMERSDSRNVKRSFWDLGWTGWGCIYGRGEVGVRGVRGLRIFNFQSFHSLRFNYITQMTRIKLGSLGHIARKSLYHRSISNLYLWLAQKQCVRKYQSNITENMNRVFSLHRLTRHS